MVKKKTNVWNNHLDRILPLHPTFAQILGETTPKSLALIHAQHLQGSINYQSKQGTFIREFPQNYNIFVLFDPPKIGKLMTPALNPALTRAHAVLVTLDHWPFLDEADHTATNFGNHPDGSLEKSTNQQEINGSLRGTNRKPTGHTPSGKCFFGRVFSCWINLFEGIIRNQQEISSKSTGN